MLSAWLTACSDIVLLISSAHSHVFLLFLHRIKKKRPCSSASVFSSSSLLSTHFIFSVCVSECLMCYHHSKSHSLLLTVEVDHKSTTFSFWYKRRGMIGCFSSVEESALLCTTDTKRIIKKHNTWCHFSVNRISNSLERPGAVQQQE